MKKIALVLINFFIIFNIFTNTLFAAEKKKNVLIINSYHKGFEWSDKVISGMEKAFYTGDVDSNILYMDSKRIASDDYFNKLKELYSLQLKKHKYDLVVAIDKFAYAFVLQNCKELEITQPIYFIGLEQYSKKEIKKYGLEGQVNGMLERREIRTNIEQIIKLNPKLNKLYILNDQSINGDDSNIFIENAIKTIKNKVEIEYIRKIKFDDLKKKFSKYKKNEALFYVRFYNDITGKLYQNYEIAEFIKNAKIPVFITDDLFIKRGAVGGKLVDIKKLGYNSAKEIKKILRGEINGVSIKIDDSYNYIYDYEKVKEFNLNPYNLNKEFEYVNEPLTFFEKNRQFINFVFIISPFLIFLVLGLMHNLYLRVKSTRKLKQRMQFDKVLLNSIKSPIVWEDEKGFIVDTNSKFEELLQMSSDRIKGKRLKDFIENGNVRKLLNLLKTFVDKNCLDDNVIVLKSRDNKEHMYMLDQTDYTENIYNTSGTVLIFTDVTQEKLALREKIKHQEFMIQQSKLAEIGEIFSSIAHQWKTPLLEITTIVQEQIYNKTNNKQIDEENNEFVNDIMVQVKYMGETISDFQNFIMPSTRKVSFNISEAVTKMLEIINHNIKYNYIKTEIKVEEGARLNILGYKNELMQILLNIVNNAKDAIVKRRKNKEVKEGKIRIEIRNEKEDVIIQIEDNGGGIPKEHIRNIFKAYYTTKENGHGIGLYMAKLIIEDKMDGSIWVENTKNGAKFSIKLGVNNENIIARR
ncbi:two-component system sensor histidine kinase [Malaciobacter halophilus]|uniref:sensor histidine kinase n=1 Tax=Malaciobacter halophilus TaxID=197482 RepID=UPI000E0C74A7|nr:ABC transporter substrate binding protein [Malaciobacter halophilus]AXH10785.1 two-component system sensor histidine kinase [Malaciobacter halophilus]